MPAPMSVMGAWLWHLGRSVAGPSLSEAEVRDRVKHNAGLLRHATAPRCAFTVESLQVASRQFKFWPSYAELWEFVEEVASRVKSLIWSLGKVIDRGVWSPPPPERPLTREEQQERTRRIAAIMRDYRARNAEATHPAPRKPGRVVAGDTEEAALAMPQRD